MSMTVLPAASVSGLGNGALVEPDPVRVVEEGRAGDREPHAAQLGDDPVGALELVRAQPPADPRALVDDRPQPELHQLVGGHHPGQPRPHDGDRGTAGGLRDRRRDPRDGAASRRRQMGNRGRRW